MKPQATIELQVAESPPAKTHHQHVAIDAPPPPPVSEAGAILSMIERAARDPSVDIEKFERLMAMRERMEARAAKQAFDNAISMAKGEIGPIHKNKTVDFTSQKGRTNYRHEDFAEVARAVDPVLKRHGLSYRFRSAQDGAKLSLTCILSHRDGYAEETTLEAGRDDSGNKNAIQGVGSTATYLQRYTLKLVLGLAASDDDDGVASGKTQDELDETISPEQIKQMTDRIRELGANAEAFRKAIGVASFAEIYANKFDAAMALLNRKAAK
jgi:hypothetical protein